MMYVFPPAIALTVVLIPLVSTASVLPRIRVSPSFVLQDHRGQPITNQDLRGSIVLTGLATLECGDHCLAQLDTMRAAAESSRSAGDSSDTPPVKMLVVVVSPTENPEVVRQFAADHDLTGEEWIVVSGTESAISVLLASGFEVYFERSPDGVVTHGPGIFLTDHVGILRAEYRTGVPARLVVAGDIERIQTEATAGKVGGLLYNAAHSLSLSCGT